MPDVFVLLELFETFPIEEAVAGRTELPDGPADHFVAGIAEE